MINQEVTKVTVNERVKMVEYPDNLGKLIIVYSAEGYYEKSIYIDSKGIVVPEKEFLCFAKDESGERVGGRLEILENECLKGIISVSPFSITVLKINPYCTVIPGPRGPIYICIPPGTPC